MLNIKISQTGVGSFPERVLSRLNEIIFHLCIKNNSAIDMPETQNFQTISQTITLCNILFFQHKYNSNTKIITELL